MIKFIFDLTLALVGLIIFFPVLLVTAFLVTIKIGRPFIFIQKRPGKNGVPFNMYKFRSMTNECNDFGELLPNEDRLTSFGKMLRATSLDELPELINVIKGEMSIVGPRPLRMHYVKRYNKFQHRRHEVKPGITGWAQVNGRNVVSWEERFKMDVWYVDNQTFFLDLKIIFKTISKVLFRKDISPEEENFMSEFMGNE